MTQQLNTIVIGASGYTGAELIRLLLEHPCVNITALTADSQAGKPMAEVYPHLAFTNLPDLVKVDEVDFTKSDLVFCCLPHGMTQEIVKNLPEHLVVIDLSADFRLKDADTYAQWYGHEHYAPDLQKEAVYGLTEWNRDAVKNARIIACPGCYPTCSLLPLIPSINKGLVDKHSIIIDAKSGVSGAGRKVAQNFLYNELNESTSAYGVGKHRHVSEIQQELGANVMFTPHLVPMSRGMLATIYVSLSDGQTAESLKSALLSVYKDEPFVQVIQDDSYPSTKHVTGTNQCIINVFPAPNPKQAVIVSVIDNLTKGASGQAVQNMNIRFGFEEILGLPKTAMFP
jgi:N-acetyl-gamma-glutamyl-phosphate reductase